MLITVQKKDAEFTEMCDLKTLKQWARSGQLNGTDLVKVDGEWLEARQTTMLKGIFATQTWDMAEEVVWTPLSPKPVVDTEQPTSSVVSVSSNVPEQVSLVASSVDTSTVAPKIGNTAKTSTSATFADIEREYQRSKPVQSMVNESEPVDLTVKSRVETDRTIPNISSSSRGMPQHTDSASKPRWNPEVDIRDQMGLLVDEVPAKSQFSWIRLMILVLPGAAILFFIRAFVVSEAQTVFPDENTPKVTSANAESSSNAPLPTNVQSDTLYALESELKGMLRNNAQQVTPEQSLSDALRVDFEYVGLKLLRIDAKVLSWKGRLLDQPRSASIDITIESEGELEREFILASLVIAKYSVRYYLEMPEFTLKIRDGDLLIQKTIQTEKAQYLYLQPGSLKEFIAELAK